MGRYSLHPVIYDECRAFDIGVLSKAGYLKYGTHKSTNYYWKVDNDIVASVSLIIFITPKLSYIDVHYRHDGDVRHKRIRLTPVQSNINKGLCWYIVCPTTGTRCKKLYVIDGEFAHRTAIKGGFYDCQVMSQHYRYLNNTFKGHFLIERIYEELHKPYFKRSYKRNPTRKLVALQDKINAHYRQKKQCPIIL